MGLHKMEELYQVNLSYATFGIIAIGGIVRETAPIGKWMIGKNLSYVRRWVKQKQGTISGLQ